MKKLKMIKKIIAVIMAALIINIATLSPVLEVKASDVPAEASIGFYPIVQALLEILGITNGLGVSYEGMNGTSSDMAQEMIDKWNAGESLQMGEHTIADLRVATNMFDFLYNLKIVYDAHVDGSNPIPYLEKMDAKSFAASGSLYSKTMQAVLAVALYNFSEEINTAFWNTILIDSPDNLNNQFDFKATSMLLDALVAGQAAYAGDVTDAWLAPVGMSEWSASNLYSVNYDYNGINVPVMKTSTYSFTWHSSNIENKIVFNKPVYVVCAGVQTRSPYIHMVCDEQFTYTLYSKSNGEWVAGATTNVNSLSDGLYYKNYGFSNYVSSDSEFVTVVDNNAFAADFRQTVAQELYGFNYTDNAGSIDSSVTDAFSGYGRRRVTGADAVNLANALSGVAGTLTGTAAGVSSIADTIAGTAATLPDVEVDAGTDLYSGILGKIYALLQNLAAAIWGYFATPLTNIKDAILTIPALIAAEFAGILTIPQILIDDLSIPVVDIRDYVKSLAESVAAQDYIEPNNGHSEDYLLFLSSLFLLILILIKLLMIFFHCMEFIIAIFQIPAGTAFLPEEMILGLDYTKSLTIPGIGMSVYSFMIGLVYICIMFYAIRTLRINIDKIKMPGRK